MAYLIDDSYNTYQYLTLNDSWSPVVLSGTPEDTWTDNTDTFYLIQGKVILEKIDATKFIGVILKGEFELGRGYNIYGYRDNGSINLMFSFVGTGVLQEINTTIANWNTSYNFYDISDSNYHSKFDLHPDGQYENVISKIYYISYYDKSNDYALESYVDTEITRVSGLISAGTSGIDGTSGSSGVNGIQGTIIQDEDFFNYEGLELPYVNYGVVPENNHDWYYYTTNTGLTTYYVTGGTVVCSTEYGGQYGSWNCQVSQNNVHLVNNQNYKYNVIAWSNQATGATMEVFIQDNNNDPFWKAIGTSTSQYSQIGGTAWTFPLTDVPTQFVLDFYINDLSLIPNVAVYNQLATYSGTTYIKNCFIQIDSVDGTSGTSGVDGTSGSSGVNGADGGSLDSTISEGAILYKYNGLTGSTLLTFSGNSLTWKPSNTSTSSDYWDTNAVGFKLEESQEPTHDNGFGITIGKRTGSVGCGSIAYGARMDLPTTASAWGSIGWGLQIASTGQFALAMGQGSNVSGYAAIGVGYALTVSGSHGAAFNESNIVSGDNSMACGDNNTAQGQSQFICGSLAISTGTTTQWDPNSEKFIVGAGTDWGDRFNAFTVSHNKTVVNNTLVLKDIVTGGYYSVQMSGGTMVTTAL